ncbi:MAG: bifunctional adenosylcobinamide kinase/adenosylcobinamide-phosphate guanylyltransferase [Desulfohalobiaceae bacterium]|nr:bifunctional adenosylcobinamide kinase/adenosylcobinamide-phosphate guanylyltransferase [Desulfohalobiaceae bacterium]
MGARNRQEVILVLGGCRSGKSAQALDLAEALPGEQRVFVATSVPRDPEMQKRVERHQQERGQGWRTVECPLDLAGTIAECGLWADVLLIDCLTLWVANLLEQQTEESIVQQALDGLLKSLEQRKCPVIFVGNEVGAGVVPENRLARMFRDANGLVNQRLAARADRVIWTVAGLAVGIKGSKNPGEKK